MDDRAASFVGCLLWFRHKVVRQDPNDKIAIWREYLDATFQFHLKLGDIRRDFLMNEEFINVSDDLGNFKYAQIAEGDNPCALICEKIDRLRQILEHTGPHSTWKEPLRTVPER